MSADTPQGATNGLLRRAVRRRWPLLVIWSAVLALLCLAYVASASATYTSTAEVLVRPLEGNAFAPTALSTADEVTVGLTTEANLVGSPQVLAVAGAIGPPVRSGQQVTGEVVLNSQMIRISYSAASARQAQDGAAVVARAFLDFRRTAAERVRNAEIDRLQGQIAQTSKALSDVTSSLDRTNPPAGASARAQVLTTRLSGLQESLGTAEAVSTDPGAVVVPAVAPGSLQSLKPVLLVVFGGLMGLLAALVFACWRTWVEDPVTADDRRLAGLPVWATVPALGDHRPGRRADRRKRLAEHYRRLRTVMVAELPDPCVITLGGVDESTDLGEVAANLAACLHAGGFDATLVDCDAEHGSLSRLLGLQGEPGLCDVLTGGPQLSAGHGPSHRVRVIPIGTAPELGPDLIARHAFDDLVATLVRETSYLVLVVPELGSAVGLRCSGLSDAVVLVAADGRTLRGDVEDVVARAALGAGTTAAAVIARLPRRPRVLRRRRGRRGRAHEAVRHSLAVVEQLHHDEPAEQPEPAAPRGGADVGETA
jgi:hypothetical protein